MTYHYDHPMPALTVDTVVLTHDGHVLLIERRDEPFAGCWALPGGFVNKGEDLVDAACRELREETTLERGPMGLQQLGAFGSPGRDPRGWVVSVAFTTLSSLPGDEEVRGCDDAREARWFPLDKLPPLAFDHAKIIAIALQRRSL